MAYFSAFAFGTDKGHMFPYGQKFIETYRVADVRESGGGVAHVKERAVTTSTGIL